MGPQNGKKGAVWSGMTRKELCVAVERTMAKLNDLKARIKATEDPREKRKLKRQFRELQVLQNWHLDQLGLMR